MSIIPVGTRKDQIQQGPLKNQSILDSAMFKKFGQGAIGLDPNKPKPDQPGQPNDLNRALDEGGGLNGPGQADKHENTVDQMNQAPPSSQGVPPAGVSGESPFLQPPDPMEGQVQSNPMLQQMDQIEQVVQGFGFKMKLRERGQGKGTIELIPMRPMQRENYKRILQGLQNLGLDPTGVDLPGEPISNDPVYMEYTSGTGGQKEVMKPGK